MRKRAGDIIQSVSLTLCLVGFVFMAVAKAPLPYLFLTIGALAFAVGTKVKGY